MRTASLLLLALLSGCTTSYALRADALAGLDGYDAAVDAAPRTLKTISQGDATFDGQNLTLKTGTAEVKGEFLKLDVREQLLLGTLRGGREVSLALTDLRAVQLTHFSPVKTVGLVLAIVAGVGAIVAAGFGIDALSRARFPSFSLNLFNLGRIM